MAFRDQRQERRTPIDILLNKYIDGEPYTVRAVNISAGGMLLYKIIEPDSDPSEVSLEFQLPGSLRVLRADGVVLTEDADARAHAVRFTHMADEDRELVARYLRGDQLEDAIAL